MLFKRVVAVLFTTEIDDCSTNFCAHGTCMDSFMSFWCSCDSGYTGEDCAIDVDECSSNPCFNGGTCIDEPNAFSCNCTEGYTDAWCELDPSTFDGETDQAVLFCEYI